MVGVRCSCVVLVRCMSLLFVIIVISCGCNGMFLLISRMFVWWLFVRVLWLVRLVVWVGLFEIRF